jgi:hypothetical protein
MTGSGGNAGVRGNDGGFVTITRSVGYSLSNNIPPGNGSSNNRSNTT